MLGNVEISLELAQFPVTVRRGLREADLQARQREVPVTVRRGRSVKQTSDRARLAQGVVNVIWLDLGPLNQG